MKGGAVTDTPKKDNTKVETMLHHMGRSVEELRSSEAWTAMLQVQAKFHRYSASNQLMIYLQRPDATQVAGYRQWQSMGRQVLKGEKGLKIFAPMTRKDRENNDEVKLVGFKLVSVFDVSQTEGDEIPHVAWPEAGSCPPGLAAMLAAHVEALGYHVADVIEDPEVGPTGARGWYVPTARTIYLRDSSEAQLCSTLLHEAGHAFDPLLTDDPSRGRKELVAESVAYVLGLRFGVECVDEVTHYLASWEGGVDELLAIVDRVKKAVDMFDSFPAQGEATAAA